MTNEYFNDYMNERIENCLRKLKVENEEYKNEREKYKKMYENLYEELPDDKAIKLDGLLDQLFYTVGFERNSIYITAFQDTKELLDKDYIIKNIK